METGTQPWALAEPSDLQMKLESAPQASHSARKQLQALSDQLPALVLADLRTVVSELINNCVRHGTGSPIELTVELVEDGSVRGCVSDGGTGPVGIGSPKPAGEGGLGLRIVDAIAWRWGVCSPSTDVWFELVPAA